MILREALVGHATLTVNGQDHRFEYTRKPALYARECCACGKAFQMEGDQRAGFIRGMFEPTSTVKGNMFLADVCSFACAETIMSGGWKRLPEQEPFVRLEAKLVRCEVTITSCVKWEAELIREWEADPEQPPRVHQ